MKFKLRTMAILLGAAGLVSHAAYAQEKVRIGFLTDISGAYGDLDGKNGAMAIQMAIDDFGGKLTACPLNC